MKATPEDVAKSRNLAVHDLAMPASMKATPEDVAKEECKDSGSTS